MGKRSRNPSTASCSELEPKTEEAMDGLNCPHKSKKGLFKAVHLRKKLKGKNTPMYCEDCSRLQPPGDQLPVWLCVSCSYFVCEERKHVLCHFKAARSGAEHPIFLNVITGKFRCFSCETDLETTDGVGGPLKTFISDYNTYVKGKTRSETSVQEVRGGNEESLIKTNNILKNSRRSKMQNNDVKSNEKSRRGLLPVVGLVNIGNTCFFNSTVQCLLHTHLLALYVELIGKYDIAEVVAGRVLVGDKYVEVPGMQLPLEPFDGPLNDVFGRFICNFRSGRSIDPRTLLNAIVRSDRKAHRFGNGQQQDAHELLRFLLDGLRTEELDRYKKAITKYIGDKEKFLNVNDTKLLSKGMLRACGRPLLDAVFGGTLLQTIRCCNCDHLSKTYEEFLDLSLPLPLSSSQTSFNGDRKMRKSASLSLSKHQKKKERALLRKRTKRRGEALSQDAVDNESVGERNSLFPESVDSSDLDDIDSNDNLCEKMRTSVSLDDHKCLDLLAEPSNSSPHSLDGCLSAFVATEVLSAQNAYECEKCCSPFNETISKHAKKRTVEAEKRYLIYEPPAVLTLHLKRFEQVGIRTQKSRIEISFPLMLDLAQYCTRAAKRINDNDAKVLYSLYGVVSHSGGMSSGHYIAYIRNRSPSLACEKFFYEAGGLSSTDMNDISRKIEALSNNNSMASDGWWYASDSSVHAVSESSVLKTEAYLLFYERIF